MALYARIDPNVHDGLTAIAELADLPLRTVVEALSAAKLGMPHPHITTVDKAARRYRKETQP